jgi:hypothetical protein
MATSDRSPGFRVGFHLNPGLVTVGIAGFGNRESGLAGIAGPGFGKSPAPAGIPGPISPGSGESTPMRARASGISGPVQKKRLTSTSIPT